MADQPPPVPLHFTPTSSSWLNLVERWFRDLTDKRLRRASFNSVPDLVAAIEQYLAVHNDDPNPLVWTATADSILAKVQRGPRRPPASSQSIGRRTTSSPGRDAAPRPPAGRPHPD